MNRLRNKESIMSSKLMRIDLERNNIEILIRILHANSRGQRHRMMSRASDR